ncbi:hypothetical protein HMPREF9120_00471 [Neisseria sp. oral taxon 020 str. F0370]|uniref:MafB family polymorphic toxin n=1 Tax=Neisseria sp. oral taxon 020 TaxID=712401 RepID=UPI0002A25D73|nr:MafB family polymorphic toxin [Neisseria sp. oral taxon 020]EKY09309.1 hypothetical protein HMPREF9120_00471 [Neisseria sp. oral taxon 020 str. F0370]
MMKTALKQKLAAILLAASALFGAAAQATAQPLATDPAILKLVDKKSYEPGGKNHLFGGARGNVRERHGNLGIIASSSMRAGNIETEYVSFGGHYGYETRFRSHPWQDHSPFDHSAVRNGGNKGAAAADGYGAANYVYSISGSMVHPADGYDGAAGGGYPAPTGARDVYSYSVSGTASRSRLVEPEKAPCFAGACQPSVEPGLGAEKRREQTENALPDGMRAEADAAAAARGVAQAERLLRDYHIDGVKLGFSYDDLIKMGYGMPPEALAVAKGASLTRKHPDEYVQAVSQGLNRLERYESEQGQKLIESGTREIDLIFRPFDPALSWKGNTANKTAAALRGFNYIANYAGDASGINPLFGAAWNTVVPDDVSQSIGNQIGQVKNDMNNWAGSDAEKQAYVALALAGTETAANVVPGRFGKGKIPHAGKGRSPHGDIPHGGSGSPHGGNPHPNRGSPHGENHSKPHGSNPHSSGNPHGNPSASLHPGHSGGHTALPNRRPGIPYTHGGHYGSRPSAGHGSHNGGNSSSGNPSGNYGGAGGIHNDGLSGNNGGNGAGNGLGNHDGGHPRDGDYFETNVPNVRVKGLSEVKGTSIDVDALRHELTFWVASNNTRDISIAAARVTINGETKHYLGVSGSSWKGNSPDEVTINNVEYEVIRRDSGSLGTAENGKKSAENFNHAEIKLASHINETYGGTNAKVEIAVQNTSRDKLGACEYCRGAKGETPISILGKLNQEMDITFYHGSTGVNP